MLFAAGGAANAQIARDLGCSTATARTWRRRFVVRGIPGLFDKPRSGRPEVHGPSARLAVIAVATSVPPDGESQWSRAMIAGHLAGRGLAISPATVGRVLAEAKVRPHKVRGWLNHADDPSFWIRAGQVSRIYLNPPPGTVLISVDQKTGIQAKSRKHPEIPARPGPGHAAGIRVRPPRHHFHHRRDERHHPGKSSPSGSARTEPPRSPPSWACCTDGSRLACASTWSWTTARPAPPPPPGPGSPPTPGSPSPTRPSMPPGSTSGGAVVRCIGQAAAAPRQLTSRDDPEAQDHRVHHPAQQARPAVQVELRRRRRPRPLPRTPPPPRTRDRPPGSRISATLGNQEPVRN